MNSDTIDDLKQFISATVVQETSSVRRDIKRLDAKIDHIDMKLSTKIDDLAHSVAGSARYVYRSGLEGSCGSREAHHTA